MNLYVWVEPRMSLSNWYHELKRGLLAGLNNRHTEATFQILDDPDHSVLNDAFIILAGETYSWYEKMLTYTNEHSIISCVVACEHPMHSNITVTSDYRQTAYNMMQYFYDAGKRRIAFFGVNPSSPHDNMRLDAFRRAITDFNLESDENDIYYTTGSIAKCYSSILLKLKEYDAILAANDLYAFFVIILANTAGLNVPEDLFVAGFGNTTLSFISKPTITTASINLYDIGYLAIQGINIFNRNKSIIELDLKSEDIYYARESTAEIRFSDTYKHISNPSFTLDEELNIHELVTSFNDTEFMTIVNYEKLFRNIDQIDYSIIKTMTEMKCT